MQSHLERTRYKTLSVISNLRNTDNIPRQWTADPILDKKHFIIPVFQGKNSDIFC